MYNDCGFPNCLISIVPYQLSTISLGWTYKTCKLQYFYAMDFAIRILKFLQFVDFYSLFKIEVNLKYLKSKKF